MSSQDFPAFDGFPYLATILDQNYFHLLLAPKSFTVGHLLDLAHLQAVANELPTYVVLGFRLCIHVDSRLSYRASSVFPGGFMTSGQLKPGFPLLEDEDLLERIERLETFKKDQHDPSNLFSGDPTNGGRAATSEETIELLPPRTNSVPRGLVQCIRCREWKGFCLDLPPSSSEIIAYPGTVLGFEKPSYSEKNYIMGFDANSTRNGRVVVSCRCENDNFCAQCERPLCDRKLNSNYFIKTDERISYVPGTLALKHKCDIIDAIKPKAYSGDIGLQLRQKASRWMWRKGYVQATKL